MELEDLDNITVTSKNVSQLASIALELNLPEDAPVRKNIRIWYDEHSPANMMISSKLQAIQDMLDNKYPIAYISKSLHIGNKKTSGLPILRFCDLAGQTVRVLSSFSKKFTLISFKVMLKSQPIPKTLELSFTDDFVPILSSTHTSLGFIL